MQDQLVDLKEVTICFKKVASSNLPFDLSYLTMLDFFNGTNYLETVIGKIDLVSFNSTLTNTDLISKLQGH